MHQFLGVMRNLIQDRKAVTPFVPAGLTESEQNNLVLNQNSSAADYPKEKCIHDLLEQQALLNPSSTAIVFQGTALTYRELDEGSTQLAHVLSKRGVGPEVLVGVCLERSLEMMVALLGILKAGGAYVPIDPSYPGERIRYVLEDAQVQVLLTQEGLLSSLPSTSAQVLCLDSSWGLIEQESREPVKTEVKPENLAYVIYTSGSTGKPKGVQIEHRSVVNFLCSMRGEPGLDAKDTLLAVTTLSFDIAGLELYLPLLVGGRLEIADRETASDGRGLMELLQRSKATVMQATPTTWRLLFESGWGGDKELKVLVGGEALPSELAKQLVAQCGPVWNLYGPTETTIWSSRYRVRGDERLVPIGRPIANTTFYILDRNLQPVPVGREGELYIGGEGLARGYFQRPELTAEKFVEDPFSGKPGARMYRTGDLARYREDGTVEYLGRLDNQVKIRGFRIELGEIEAVLAEHPAVQDCVIAAREDVPGDKRLVAYIISIPGQQVSGQELRAWVKEKLPAYMLPQAFVEMEKFPLTPNGKVNRKALPAPEYQQIQSPTGRTAARTPIEEIIASIWSEVLRLDHVGLQNNFFELGGHSLAGTQVVSRIREAFNVDMPLRVMFETPTVEAQALRVEQLRRQGSDVPDHPLVRAKRKGGAPLSFAQRRLWFLDQLEPLNPLYNVPYIVRLQGPMNSAVLEDSLNEIVRRHETLRTRFEEADGEPVQVVEPWQKLPLSIIDLSHQSPEARLSEARRLATEEAKCPFDLRKAPLMRAVLIRLAADDHALILNMHHIVTDRWSWGVLSQELAGLYEASLEGKPSPLEELPIQYGDYAVWQHAHLGGGRMEQQIAYWKKQLEGAPPVLKLPTDRPRQAMQNFWGGIHSRRLTENLANDLRVLSRRHGVTLFMTLLAGFQALLARLANQDDVVVGTDLANRTEIATEKLIGFFVNLLPIRTQLSGNPNFAELLDRVREVSLGAFAHQDAPFEELVKELQPERSLAHHPLVQVLFVMQNTPQGPREFGGLTPGPLGVSSTSRFDLVLFINNPDQIPVTTWMYNPNLFDASTIARFAELYELLLRSVAAEPDAPLSRIYDALDEAEHHLHEAAQKAFQETSLRKLKGARRKAAVAPADGEVNQG